MTPIAAALFAAARLAPEAVYGLLGSTPSGLSDEEVERRLARDGLNQIAAERTPSLMAELLGRALNPLNFLLATLAVTSWFLGDRRAAVVILVMVVLSITLAFLQEHRSNQAAARLRSMVKTMASVRRNGRSASDVPLECLVAGDLVMLSAGDMIPADIRLVESKDFFVNQSALTGESMPVEKHSGGIDDAVSHDSPFSLDNLCFMGSNVVSGYATAIIIHCGERTSFGQLAQSLAVRRPVSAFDRGINRFTWLMVRFMGVMVPAVFVINLLTKGNWLESVLFAVAVAVGLTPEMLPMIVTVNLAKGALQMARRRVIVKRLDSIQNFGAMDVLCTDKTGTLTQDHIILKRHLDLGGQESDRVLEYAFLNSHHQSGLRNLLDLAVLHHVELHPLYGEGSNYRKVDEIPFDFERRRLSVVVASGDGPHLLICKGAVEEVFSVCTTCELDGVVSPLDATHLASARSETEALNADGFRVVAVASRSFARPQGSYSREDERDLTLLGYIAFLDPPKESAAPAIAALHASGVGVKILTGDNDIVTRKICNEVGIDAGRIVLGPELDNLDRLELATLVEKVNVFARLTPAQKALVIEALRRNGHVVGFLGDGINDSPALKAADVGISVDTAVDIARESADIILLEKSLAVLQDGVIEGRKVFGNIIKYIRMGASSNFGNMLSVLGASAFLPFLPMTPIQVVTNNLLYDFSQTAIPTDRVDAEYLERPRRWDISGLFKFMIVVGPVSSIFDYATFFTLIWFFDGLNDAPLFQTGWFVESILTQTLVIHVIRTARIPFIESLASVPLLVATFLVCLAAIALPYTSAGEALGFVPLPVTWWPWMASFMIGYAILAHLMKTFFARRWGL
jgi:Mg2+-importing ATPase